MSGKSPSFIDEHKPMMTAKRIMKFMTAEPFRLFRINVASGKSSDIRHPEMAAVGRTTIHVSRFYVDER